MVVTIRNFDHKVHYELDIDYRVQWSHAGGYCGENSVQTIAQRFGIYASQELIRKYADNRELLVGPPGVIGHGGHDDGPYAGHMACETMGLDYDLFDTLGTQKPQQHAYYNWCRDHTKQGNYPIVCYSIPPIELAEGEVTSEGHTAASMARDKEYNHIVNVSDVHEFHGKDWRDSFWMIHGHGSDGPLPYMMKNMDGSRREPHPDLGLQFPYFKDECYGMTITGKSKRLEGEVPVALTLKMTDRDRLVVKEAPYDVPETVAVRVVASGLKCDSTYRIEKGQEPSLDVDSTVVLDSGEEVTVQKFDDETKQWVLQRKDGTTLKMFGMELLQYTPVGSFTATGATFTWKDPEYIDSHGAYAYRCIEE